MRIGSLITTAKSVAWLLVELFIAIEYDVVIIGLIFFSYGLLKQFFKISKSGCWAVQRMLASVAHILKLEQCRQYELDHWTKMTC